MATFDDTFSPAALARTDTIISPTSAVKAPPSAAAKQPKATQSYPRIDLEPLYTELKSLIGHHWETYYDALTRFIRGELNAREFGDLCDSFIYVSPQTEHTHNSLILAVLYNTSKDPPDPGLAAWVSATTDKSAMAASSKPAVTSDAGEQRLKVEVMALPARDRRRLKTVANDKAEEETAARRNPYEDYHAAGRIKAPEATTGSASGLTRTNWDLEIRKRYLQPLFAETLEFPDQSTIHARMVPICYEEAVPSGCSVQCADLVGLGAETYLKRILSELFDRTRSNGPRYENSHGGGILTASHQQKLAREEADVRVGKLRKTRDDDILPCEAQAAHSRRPLGMTDLQLTTQVGPLPWNGTPLIGWTISNASAGYDYEDWYEGQEHTTSNGHVEKSEDAMDIDNSDNYGWEGAGSEDRSGLESVLADCLAISV